MLIKRTRFPIGKMLTVGMLPLPLKILYYRMGGAKIGANVLIGPGSVIIADELEIGEGAQVGFGTYLRARKIKIGRFARIGSVSFFDAETIEIGEDAKISEQVFVGGLSSPESHFHLGSRTILMQHTFINVARPVWIGDNTGIGGKCTIFTHGSWQNMLDGYPVSFAPIHIGDNVWIPWQVFVMPGVSIGDGATIGANSLVTKSIPAGALAVGNPAKVIRTSEEYPNRPTPSQKIEMLKKIMIEFREHLEHSGIRVDHQQQPAWDGMTCHKDGSLYNLAVLYEQDILPEDTFKVNVVMSLFGFDKQTRAKMNDENQMWVDLKSNERGGRSNAFGEELVEYVKRFGIRLIRTC